MTWVQKASSAEEAYTQARKLDPEAKLNVSKVGEGRYLVKTTYGSGTRLHTYTESVKNVRAASSYQRRYPSTKIAGFKPTPEQPSHAVTIEGSYKTSEEAQKASTEISKAKDIHSTHVVRQGTEYVVRGKYTGDPSRLKVVKTTYAKAGAMTTTAPKETAKVVEVKTKPGEKQITPKEAYDVGLISQRDYERSQSIEGSYVIVKEGSVKAAKELTEKWKGKHVDPSPGQRRVDQLIWAEQNVPYMAEDEATRKTIKAVSKGLTAKEIEQLREPTFGQKLVERTREVRKVQGENVFQWMGEGVVEYGGAVLHGGEMLLRPAGRKAIANVVFDMPAPDDRGNIFEVVQGTKQGSLLQQAAVSTGKDLYTQITTHPVEFGVKTATVLALSYGISKGVGYYKSVKAPVTHSVGKGKVVVSPKGEIAVGKSTVATIIGKSGKQGKFMTKVSSVFKTVGKDASGKTIKTKGAHILKTQPKTGGKVITTKGVTVDVTTKTGKMTAVSKQAGLLKTGKKVTGTLGKYKHKTIYEVDYGKPTIMQFGNRFVNVVSKSDLVSYGKTIALKAAKKTKVSVRSKGDILSRTQVYQTGGATGGSGGSPITFFKSKLGTGTFMSGGVELAKKAGESIARASIRKQSGGVQVPVPLPKTPTTTARVVSAPTMLDVVVQSPAKLIMGPTKKRGGSRPPGPSEIAAQEQRMRVSMLSGELTKTIEKQTRDFGRATANLTDMKLGTGFDERVIPAVVTPQIVSPRMRQHQTEALLFATITGVRSRVGHPTPVPQTLLPSSFRPATIFPFARGMDLEVVKTKKKKKPAPWWAGLHIHPVRNPIELFGIPVAKTRRKK